MSGSSAGFGMQDVSYHVPIEASTREGINDLVPGKPSVSRLLSKRSLKIPLSLSPVLLICTPPTPRTCSLLSVVDIANKNMWNNTEESKRIVRILSRPPANASSKWAGRIDYLVVGELPGDEEPRGPPKREREGGVAVVALLRRRTLLVLSVPIASWFR